ncbi:hypothetical protein BN7_2304 [Wickerhamomyces ciferrii]|uniref:Activator of Hsp90 ATPase AHSA1-like N-terminal domain-containing protein n=1 Tax=Wickerhamomyces ciferrii (strain ATCC 14091 / BCRC 22168 / CBS 111 / JCM 3599 / NBRC 0793 / NRRL Y-1031 F-60-10) TaxID=1206466 RepID=K0KCH6_WICCF|nr:uncharacterized protein BN7_2304 [Wickerhamomyces ciferrii]CCH42760.1 hypothetical protein BN7_2304 [Wickerhamomyces ciferrii]
MVVNNPNNWHWVNKNCLPWSKQYFIDNLENLKLDNDAYVITITNSSISGDCDVTQRKGKVLCIYDMVLSFDVEGEFKKSGESIKGSVKIPEFIHDEDDYDYQLNEFGDYKAQIRKEFIPLIHERLIKFQKDLIDSHSKDVQE